MSGPRHLDALCRWARDHDRAGTLGDGLEAPGLTEAVRRAAIAEEGWILGCPAPASIAG